MMSALLDSLTWTTPGQTPWGLVSSFSSTDFFALAPCLLRTSHPTLAAMQLWARQCLRAVPAMPTFETIAQLPKILIIVLFDRFFPHHSSPVIPVERYLKWWKVYRERWYFWFKQRMQLEKTGPLHAAMQCGAVEWPAGHQGSQNSPVCFSCSSRSNGGYQVRPCFWEGRSNRAQAPAQTPFSAPQGSFWESKTVIFLSSFKSSKQELTCSLSQKSWGCNKQRKEL